jgi:hypothetical protein
MVPIAGPAARPAALSAGRQNDAPAAAPSVDSAEAGRALIPVQPIARRDHLPLHGRRPEAGFLAHLIATEWHVPQTRERRRAEPGEAITAYTLAKAAPPGGQKFLRSI